MVSAFKLLHDEGSPAVREKPKKRIPNNDLDFQRSEGSRGGRFSLRRKANYGSTAEQANRTYATLLRSELDLPTTIPDNRSEPYYARGGRGTTPPGGSSSALPPSLSPATPRKNLLSFVSPKHLSAGSDPTSPQRTPSSRRSINLDPNSAIYSVSPIKYESQRLLLSPQKKLRTVSKVPYKVLDAPELTDDFYLNLVDWGSSNILGVGLGKCVYMWSAESGKVNKLCELPDNDSVTSVNWIQKVCYMEINRSVIARIANTSRAPILRSAQIKATSRYGTPTPVDDSAQ
jgi:cell division cycle 20-like protein 1 (cofactor of APC complex)